MSKDRQLHSDLIIDQNIDGIDKLWQPEIIGMKAYGLLSIPNKWVPNFFVLSTDLYMRFLDLQETESFVEAHHTSQMLLFDDTPIYPAKTFLTEALSTEEQGVFLKSLRRIAPSDEDYIIVRSSALDENINARGRHLSFTCQATLIDMSKRIIEIFKMYSKDKAHSHMSIVIQKVISPIASGHLSNERRITKISSSWLCEFDSLAGIGTAKFIPFSSRKTKPHSENSFLSCGDMSTCEKILNKIASWASSKKKRLHFEWIWDGKQIWIVQADSSPTLKGSKPYALDFTIKNSPKTQQFSNLIAENDIDEGIWSKIDCLKYFRKAKLKTATVWVLYDTNLLVKLSEGQWPDTLTADLKFLLESPIVIRTDQYGDKVSDKFMMPRTDVISDFNDAKEFILEVTEKYDTNDINNVRPCFIFHRFIPARSSAFAYSQPNNPRVKIDSIWGSPDGLSYYPHDSFEYSLSSLKLHDSIRYKEDYLDVDEKGNWSPRKAGEKWDWKTSLEEHEIKTIAKGTYDISRIVGKPVQVMWFIGIPTGLGHPDILPWYYSTEDTPTSIEYSPARASLRSPLIRKSEDIDFLARTPEPLNIQSIRLRPMPDLLRDRAFIEEVALLARRLNVPVELEGSMLAHAYYLIRNLDIKVICPNVLSPAYPDISFNKLVRDEIPTHILEKGEHVTIDKFTAIELITELKAKVVEEALELYWSDNDDNAMEEIADINEVLSAICNEMNFKTSQIDSIANDKREKRGGFNKGYILKNTKELPVIAIHKKPAQKLFSDIDSINTEIKKNISSKRKMINRSPKKNGPKLIVPMIPPDPDHRFESYFFEFPSLDIAVNIRFREKEIIFEIDKTKKDTRKFLFET